MRRDIILITQANVFKLSTDLTGTPLIWTFSHHLIQQQKHNFNKSLPQEKWIKSIFRLVFNQIMDDFSILQTLRMSNHATLKLTEKDGNQKHNLMNTLEFKFQKWKFSMQSILNVWLTIKWHHSWLNILIPMCLQLSRKEAYIIFYVKLLEL